MRSNRSAVFTIWYTLTFYSTIIGGTLLFLATCPFVYAFLRLSDNRSADQRVRFLIWVYGKCWVRVLRLFTPVTAQSFTSSLPTPCIITPNHQSFFDPYFLGLWPHSNVVFFVQSWPFKIPCYGHFMKKAGYINTSSLTIDEIHAKTAQFLKDGASIAIFPEGTRSTSHHLGRFHSGAFKLAVACNVPVVPMLIQGSGVFLSKGQFWLTPTPITVKALAPRYPESVSSKTTRPDATLRLTVKKDLQSLLSGVDY